MPNSDTTQKRKGSLHLEKQNVLDKKILIVNEVDRQLYFLSVTFANDRNQSSYRSYRRLSWSEDSSLDKINDEKVPSTGAQSLKSIHITQNSYRTEFETNNVAKLDSI